MKKRSFSYTVFAIVIGYMLISAIPERVEKLVYPKSAYQEEPEILSQGDNKLDKDSSDTIREEPSDIGEDVAEAESASKADEKLDPILENKSIELVGGGSDENLSSLYGWFILDLLIALGVYFVARRLLT